jgi:hypothetical protein
MAANYYVNIKELPTVEQINPGDLLIIETEAGTSILDFSNFIVGFENTTFSSIISTNTTDIADLQSQVNTINSTLGIVSTTGTITTTAKTYIGKTTISIKNGNLTGNGILTPVPPTTLTLSKSDIIVVPANQNATLSGAYVSTYSNITPNRGQVELTAANGNSTNELIFNIFAIKSY